MNPLLIALVFMIAVFITSISFKAGRAFPVFKGVGYALLLGGIYSLLGLGLIDEISFFLGVVFACVSFFISVYAYYYGKDMGYGSGLYPLVDIFLATIVLTYVSPSFVFFVTAWTIAEIIGYTLIKLGEEHSTEGSLTSSRGFLVTSTLTYEVSAFTLIVVSMTSFAANIGVARLLEPFTHISPAPLEASSALAPFLIGLLVIGFIIKAANVPLHFWLPSAHSSAPSPASAALSGLMVSLGYYGLYRVMQLIEAGPYRAGLGYTLLALGLLSVIYGGTMSYRQRDAKLLLAYSTIATDGFVSTLFSLYALAPSELSKWVLVLGMAMHASYKATLFCEAGLIEVIYRTRYIHGVRGLTRISPLSSFGGLLAIMSLLGVPGTIGFSAKLLSIYVTVNNIELMPLASVIALLSIALYVVFSAIIAISYSKIYFGARHPRIPFNERPPGLGIQLPVAALGLFNVLFNAALFALSPIGELGAALSLISPVSLLASYITYMRFRAPVR